MPVDPSLPDTHTVFASAPAGSVRAVTPVLGVKFREVTVTEAPPPPANESRLPPGGPPKSLTRSQPYL
jgi:hypothetical protein